MIAIAKQKPDDQVIKEEPLDEYPYISATHYEWSLIEPKIEENVTENENVDEKPTTAILIDRKRAANDHSYEIRDPCLKQRKFKCLCFVKSTQDASAVEIIGKHSTEFATICATHGFNLHIECVVNGRFDVNLYQSVPSCDAQQAFEEMRFLLRQKRRKVHDLSARKELIRYFLFFPRHYSPFQERRFYLKPFPGESQLIGHEISNSCFSLLSLIMRSDEFAHDIWQRIFCELSPFHILNQYSFEMKRVKLHEYFAFITHCGGPANWLMTLQKMCCGFQRNYQLFLYQPFQGLLHEKSAQLYRNLLTQDPNIAGTIHFLPFRCGVGSINLICMAIVDYRIVAVASGTTVGVAFQNLYKLLVSYIKWNPDFKLATDMPVSDDMNDIFVHHEHPKLYLDNNKVIKWIRLQFGDLEKVSYGLHVAAIPAFYNMVLYYEEIERRQLFRQCYG